jgi:hypothetical protein
MTQLTAETVVFSSSGTAGRCVVMFLSTRQHLPGEADGAAVASVQQVISELAQEGWCLSIRRMFDPDASPQAFALDTGFAGAVDIAGAFEAPSLSSALEGTVRLEQAGWAQLFATEWLIGPREFAVVNGIGGPIDRHWGFLALWEWNDAWSAATPDERRDYDAECDVAFKGDLGFNVNIAGRHRLDWAHGWHHLGMWEVASPEIVDQAITGHERAADFMFTTSRHVLGRVTPLDALLRA